VTNEQFTEALKKYIFKNGLNQSSLAREIGRPVPTVQDWVRKGVRRDAVREKIVQAYSQLFSNGHQSEEFRPEPEPVVEAPIKAKSAAITGRQLQIIMKTELGRQNVACLSDILIWFLFSATRAERERFRDDLGDTWQGFLELTRAMTGENAFKIAGEEGRLTRWQLQQ
jgi:hypothetical protein